MSESSHPSFGKKYKIGNRELELGGKYLGLLRESTDAIEDLPALRNRLKEDGYLFIRGLHDRAQVLEARRKIIENVSAQGALDPQAPLMDGVIKPGTTRFSGDLNRLIALPAYLDLVNAPRIMGFFERLLSGKALTLDIKLLRVFAQEDKTNAHYDIVYLGRGTKNLYTCWTPLGDVALEMGPLALCQGSNRFEQLIKTYGQTDPEKDGTGGHLSDDPVDIVERYGGRWATAEFAAGDALILGMFTLHMSLLNSSNRFRISSDTRYQLASEPVDPRWMKKPSEPALSR